MPFFIFPESRFWRVVTAVEVPDFISSMVRNIPIAWILDQPRDCELSRAR